MGILVDGFGSETGGCGEFGGIEELQLCRQTLDVNDQEGGRVRQTCCKPTSVEAVDAVVIISEFFGNSIFILFSWVFWGLES